MSEKQSRRRRGGGGGGGRSGSKETKMYEGGTVNAKSKEHFSIPRNTGQVKLKKINLDA